MMKICKNCESHVHCNKTAECDCPICNDHETDYCLNPKKCGCTLCV